MRKLLASSIALSCFVLTMSVASVDCARPTTAADVEAGSAVATGACTLLTGLTQNQTVITICATVEEIALIGSFLSPLLLQARDAAACSVVSTTKICATPEELGAAIQAIVARRRALRMLDAASGG